MKKVKATEHPAQLLVRTAAQCKKRLNLEKQIFDRLSEIEIDDPLIKQLLSELNDLG